MTKMARRTAVFLLALLLAAACGGEPAEKVSQPVGSDVPQNVLVNGSFEQGEGPWFSLSTTGWGQPFRVTTDTAHSGAASVLLEMDAGEDAAGTQVFGVVQEVAPHEFPETISGFYRVENWLRGTEKQYLQFVVIVFGAQNLPGGFPNHQIRYVLAGAGQPPLSLLNAKYVFLDTAEPRTGEWVHFERNLRDDFSQAWGAVPEGFSMIRVLFEVRYDDKQPGPGRVAADAFYDDLYMGPAEANSN
jgi:hypothetical protein